MIVLARLEAEHDDMHGLLAELDKAQEAITPVLEEGAAISDEHYERMPAGEAYPSYFKGRRVFKIPPISEPKPTKQNPTGFPIGIAGSTAPTSYVRSSLNG